MEVIALGQEKGGEGKTTFSVWLADALQRKGKLVRLMDLDVPQCSAGKFYDRREAAGRKNRNGLPFSAPHIIPFEPSKNPLASRANRENFEALREARAASEGVCDYLILDCGGNSEDKTALGLAFADRIVSPIRAKQKSLNTYLHDSDLDTPDTKIAPGSFTRIVRRIRQARLAEGSDFDWVVAINQRPINADDRNRKVEQQIRNCGALPSFNHRTIDGMCDRAIYDKGDKFGLTAFIAWDPADYRAFGIHTTMEELNAARDEVVSIADAILNSNHQRAVA